MNIEKIDAVVRYEVAIFDAHIRETPFRYKRSENVLTKVVSYHILHKQFRDWLPIKTKNYIQSLEKAWQAHNSPNVGKWREVE